MDIVKAFNSNELHTEIVIKGTYDNPLFRASDIGVVLEISNIRTSIQLFNDTEKVVHTMDTLGGTQEVTFLTEKGLYKVLFKSRKPIAEKFQNWVCEIIKEIRLTGKYELEKQLDKAKQQIETNLIQSEKEKERLIEETLISQFPVNTQCVYYARIDNRSLGQAPRLHNETLIKFGQSNELSVRVRDHKKTYKNFRLVAAFKVKNKIEIENCIKRHPILQKRVRSLMINDLNHRELLALDDDNFTIEKIDEHIRDIIKENEYNIDNYSLLIDKNYKLEEDLRNLENQLKEKNIQIEKINKDLSLYKSDITNNIKGKIASDHALCKYGYYLYAFECQPMRFKCSITRQKDYDILVKNLTNLDPTGEMKHKVVVSYPLCEKIMGFLLKQSMIGLGNNIYEGSVCDIKKILDIVVLLEKTLIENGNDLDKLTKVFQNEVIINEIVSVDPETPVVRKAKRSIDQIDKNTGLVISTYESIEAAGRSLGLTTGTAIGIALREKRVCQGFLWRYAGVSKEDQYSDQPVIKYNCKTGKTEAFDTIAQAAKDAGVSAPALRQRILTNVHINDNHWVFDKNSSHYKC